jgi:hypothetical protein
MVQHSHSFMMSTAKPLTPPLDFWEWHSSIPTKQHSQPNMIDIDYTKRLDSSAYCEDIWIQEDSIWVGEKRLAAFTITEDYSNDEGKFRVNCRRQMTLADGALSYIYPRIAGFDSVAECKEFIFDYINTAPSKAIFDDQHRKALEVLCA